MTNRPGLYSFLFTTVLDLFTNHWGSKNSTTNSHIWLLVACLRTLVTVNA
jgi:hypothetical protein